MAKSKNFNGLGLVLVGLGVLFLLQNFGYLGSLRSQIWAALFGFGGLAFIWVFFTNREHWWALIPGFTLLGLAFTIGLSDTPLGGEWVGAVFLGMIGMAFVVIYLLRPDYWWAIIPAGALMTLAGVVVASSVLPGEASGGILFLGLAATFGMLYLLPNPSERLTWALIPAGILAAIGAVLIAGAGRLPGLLLPLALIAAGGVVVVRALAQRD